MKKLFFIFLFCLFLQAILISKAVVYGEAVSRLERKINGVDQDNQKLELLIASQIAYSTIAQKAVEAGFAPLAFEPKDDFSVALKR